ncbi:MAG TPA: SIS domain-containing protein [Thermaerobacter sp.]
MPPLSATRYLAEVRRVLEHIERTQLPVIRDLARAIAELVRSGGVVHVFGAGHSHMLAEEAFARAGGLVPTTAILDPGFMVFGGFRKNSALERLEGFGRLVFENYDTRPGEILVVNSQSGKNVAPVEVALAAREKGLRVAAITSLEHSRAVPPGHPSGKKLYEVADWVIDNGCPLGDAALDFGPGRPRVAPLSSVAAIAIWNMIVAEVAAILAEEAGPVEDGSAAAGADFPFWVSANVQGGNAYNERYFRQYGPRWKNLF